MTTDIQTVRGGRSMGLTPQSMGEAMQLAEYAAKSGLCAVREPAQALVVLLTGMELGLSPMQSFRGIHVVNGKPVLSADLLVAIVRASGVCRSWLTVESSIDRCTIETQREGDAAPVRKTWTSEDAKRAGLSTAVWRSYPAQMLRHRCAADLAREVYPDLALGCYTPDEVSDGRVSDADVAVTVQRDDAPAQLAAPDALAAFAADLADASDLAGVRAVYARHDLGGTSAKPVMAAVVARAAECGYHLNSAEASALCGGTMSDAVVLAYDSLVAVTRHADDEDGDGVVADVARILRRCGGLDAPTRIKTAAVATCTALGVEGAAARIKAALSPAPQPPPTGTDAPRASDAGAASADSTPVAPSQTAGATMRTVLDADEAEARLVTSAAAWSERLPLYRGTWAMAGAYHKRREAFLAAGVVDDRYAATLAAIDAHEGRGPEAARQALDGYRTRRVLPQGVGAVVQMRPHAARVAQRTGTDG